MYFIENFDEKNIDGQHIKPPIQAMYVCISLETIDSEILMDCYVA